MNIAEQNLLYFLSNLTGKKIREKDICWSSPCGLARKVANYDVDGRIYACHETKRLRPFLLGDIRDSPVEIYNSTTSEKLRNLSVLTENSVCKSCAHQDYCNPCPAKSKSEVEDGTYDPSNTEQCSKTKSLYSMMNDLITECGNDLVQSYLEKNGHYIGAE